MTALDLGTADRTLTVPGSAFASVAFGDVTLNASSGAHPVVTTPLGNAGIPLDTDVTDVGDIGADGAITPGGDWTLIVAVEGMANVGNAFFNLYCDGTGSLFSVRASKYGGDPPDAELVADVNGSTVTPYPYPAFTPAGVNVFAVTGNAAERFLASSGDGVLATASAEPSGSGTLLLSAGAPAPTVVGMWMWQGVTLSQADVEDTVAAIASDLSAGGGTVREFSASGRVNISGATATFTTENLYGDPEVVLPDAGGSVTPPEAPAPPIPPDYAPEPIRHVWQRLGAPVVDADGIDRDWMPGDEGSAPYARWQIVVEGEDVTYYLGAPTPEPDWSDTEPFGFGPASLRFPQVTVFTPMPSWARGGANVIARLVRVADSSTVVAYDGIVLRDGARFEGGSLTLEMTGYLYSVDLQLRTPAGNTKPLDMGTAIARAINGATSRRYNAMDPVVTGIKTSVAGGWEPLITGFVANLLATAVTNGRQWTVEMDGRTPRMILKDTTTVHAEVRAGQTGVEIDLGSDAAEAPNVILGEGINPDGGAWAGWRYPYFRADDTPDYPNADPGKTHSTGARDSDTDTGTGISDWQRKAGLRVTGVLSSADVAAMRRLQESMGITPDGWLGPQTWAATFKTGSNTGTLDGAFVMPLAASKKVKPKLYGPDGDDLGANPAYDPDVLVVHRKIDYGSGVWRYEAEKNAREVLARDSDPGVAGTVTLKGVDPEQMHRYELRAGMNIRVRGWRGQDVLLHIVALRKQGSTVTLTVDSKARDWPTLKAILERQRESTDPARTARMRLLEGKVGSDRPIFDAESPAGTIPRHAIFGGFWNVLKIAVGAEHGDMARTWFTTSGPAQPFSAAAFGKAVTANQLAARIGNPLTATENPWDDDTLDTDLGLLQSWGWTNQKMGYFPHSYSDPESEGAYPVTGRMVDDGSWPIANKGGYLYVALFVESPGYIEGRLRLSARR